MTLDVVFAQPLPPDNNPNGPGIFYQFVYISRMCSSAIKSAQFENENTDGTRCVKDISNVGFTQLDNAYAFGYVVDVTVDTGNCPAPSTLPVVLIAVIIVAVIIVILVAVGVLVYLRYRKRYGKGTFQTQFQRENPGGKTTVNDSRKTDRHLDRAMGL